MHGGTGAKDKRENNHNLSSAEIAASPSLPRQTLETLCLYNITRRGLGGAGAGLASLRTKHGDRIADRKV